MQFVPDGSVAQFTVDHPFMLSCLLTGSPRRLVVDMGDGAINDVVS